MLVDMIGLLKIKYLTGLKVKDNKVNVVFNGQKIDFIYDGHEYVIRNVYEIFIRKIYAQLNVRGKIVIDIGSSIGDSPIYFSLSGAKEIYAFETDKDRFEYMLSNLKNNNISNVNPKKNKLNVPNDIPYSADMVLKMDCEGCEYDLLNQLESTRKLGNFREIVLEYHNGLPPSIPGFKILNSVKSSKKVGMLYLVKE